MHTSYGLEVATLADAAAVTSLLEASYGSLMPPCYEPAVIERALPPMSAANPVLLTSGTYYKAVTGEGQVIGSGGWTKERPGTGDVEPGTAHIRHFATHPEWLGQGVGRSIYAECRKAAGAAGIRRFECYASLNAEGFYAALGFRRVRHLDIAMGPNVSLPSVLMDISL